MGESEKVLASAFKRALEGFGGCLDRLIGEVSGLNTRVGVLESEVVDLADRMNALDLKLGTVATEKIAEASFGKIQNVVEVAK